VPRIDQERFYNASIKKYGISAEGVQWNSRFSQQIRFQQIASYLKLEPGDIIVDAGCGFGDFYHFLQDKKFSHYEYIGFDAVHEMVQIAQRRTGCQIEQKDILTDSLPEADFYVCSGALNILTYDESLCFIEKCFAVSRKKFVFNFLEGEDNSLQYNYLHSEDIYQLGEKIGAYVEFRRDYYGPDCTAVFEKRTA